MHTRVIAAHSRTFIALLVGVVTWVVAALAGFEAGGPGWPRAILAWDVGAAAFIGLALQRFATRTVEQMADDAERQQEGEWTIFAVTLLVAVASFVALAGEFAGLKDASARQTATRVGLVVATLLLSWSLTHFIFAFRYAHDWYGRTAEGKPQGGLDFPGDDQPDYWDFLYFSVVLGMTFQVSDVQIKARRLRRLALLHGLLSFLFNTVIVALTVNIAAGLL